MSNCAAACSKLPTLFIGIEIQCLISIVNEQQLNQFIYIRSDIFHYFSHGLEANRIIMMQIIGCNLKKKN